MSEKLVCGRVREDTCIAREFEGPMGIWVMIALDRVVEANRGSIVSQYHEAHRVWPIPLRKPGAGAARVADIAERQRRVLDWLPKVGRSSGMAGAVPEIAERQHGAADTDFAPLSEWGEVRTTHCGYSNTRMATNIRRRQIEMSPNGLLKKAAGVARDRRAPNAPTMGTPHAGTPGARSGRGRLSHNVLSAVRWRSG